MGDEVFQVTNTSGQHMALQWRSGVNISVWTQAWWCILGSTVMEVESLDIEAADVASRKFVQLYVAWEKAALSKGDHYNWRVKPKLHLFCRVDASDHQHLWSTRTVLDLPG